MAADHLKSSPALASLRRRWALLALAWAATLVASFAALQAWWHPAYALRWLGFAAMLSTFQWWAVWHGLSENHQQGENRLLPTFGAGTRLTLLRAGLIAALAGFLLSPQPEGRLAWIPGALYLLAAITDLLDGYVARITNHATRLGEKLDMSLDGLGVLVAALLAVQYGQVPTWYIFVGLARYLFVAGIWIRQKLGRPVYELAPSAGRRPFAGTQMGFITVVLFPLFTPPATFVAATIFALPFLVGFSLDWLTVSGTLRPTPLTTVDGGTQLKIWLPLLVRAALVALLTVSLFTKLRSGTGPVLSLAIALQAAGMILLALGAAGRIAALAVLFGIGLYLRLAGLTAIDLALMVGACASFYLGTGALSLWKPEDRLIHKRLGEA